MSSIGPEIPAHLLGQSVPITGGDDDEAQSPSVGPQIPSELLASKLPAPAPTSEDDDDDDDYTPALPPDLTASRSAAPGTSIGPIGPSLLTGMGVMRRPAYDEDDSDDDVGPKPLPAGITYEEPDAVAQFIQKEENRKKNIEEASKPKALQREEWMLVPPSSSDLLGKLDPTKLSKPRQFSKSTAPPREVDSSLWTETPAERQQRIADEVSGKKRRAANAESTRSPEEELELRKRQKIDERIRQGVDAHTRNIRGAPLVERHAKAKDEDDPNANLIWDHSRDMALGGRLMDDASRAKMLKDAKSLGDRFGSSSRGGFL